jgi:hypothetical protein
MAEEDRQQVLAERMHYQLSFRNLDTLRAGPGKGASSYLAYYSSGVAVVRQARKTKRASTEGLAPLRNPKVHSRRHFTPWEYRSGCRPLSGGMIECCG